MTWLKEKNLYSRLQVYNWESHSVIKRKQTLMVLKVICSNPCSCCSSLLDGSFVLLWWNVKTPLWSHVCFLGSFFQCCFHNWLFRIIHHGCDLCVPANPGGHLTLTSYWIYYTSIDLNVTSSCCSAVTVTLSEAVCIKNRMEKIKWCVVWMQPFECFRTWASLKWRRFLAEVSTAPSLHRPQLIDTHLMQNNFNTFMTRIKKQQYWNVTKNNKYI